MSKSRNWTFTLNNPQGDEIFDHGQIKMLITNKEVGQEGTIHYQGYCEFANPVPFSTVRNFLPRAHWETRKGTQREAVIYCVKDYLKDYKQSSECLDDFKDHDLEGLEQFGLLSVGIDRKQKLQAYIEKLSLKKQSRLLHLKRCLDEGMSTKDLWQEDFETMVRHHRAFQNYQLEMVTPRSHEMEIIVIFGPTGTGKSRWCAENFPNAYWKQLGKWWDAYNQQEVVVIDEFYGWLQWTTLLRLCDRYPMMVETKGGQVQFVAKTIIFTSNTRPNNWYKDKYFDAFKRRVSQWIHMSSENNHMFFNEYDSFLRSMDEQIYIAQL